MAKKKTAKKAVKCKPTPATEAEWKAASKRMIAKLEKAKKKKPRAKRKA